MIKTALLGRKDAADIGMAAIPLGDLHGEAALRLLTRLGVDVRLGTKAAAIEPGRGRRSGGSGSGRGRPAPTALTAGSAAAPGRRATAPGAGRFRVPVALGRRPRTAR